MSGGNGAAGGDVEGARSLLRAAGLAADVRTAGRSGEIAVVSASPDEMDRLRELAPELRELGFGYVALDLTGSGQRIRE